MINLLSENNLVLNPKKPVLFFQNAIGDHVLTMPAIRALFKLYGSNLSVVSGGNMRDWFYCEFNLKYFIELKSDLRNNPSKAVVDKEDINQIQGCDLLISLCPWHTKALEILIDRIDPLYKIGYYKDYYNYPNELHWKQHAFDFAFEIPKRIDKNLSMEALSYPIIFNEKYENKAEYLCEMLPNNYKKLVVHTETKEYKEWEISNFNIVIDSFLERNPNYIVVLIDVEDRGLRKGKHLERIFPFNGFYFPTTSLVIKNTDLFLGIDSCFLHVVDLYRINGVGLFSYTKAEDWGFRFSKGIHIEKKQMSEIKVDEVLCALQELA